MEIIDRSNWAANELDAVAIRDERLVNRLIETATILAEHPGKTIPQACGSWAKTKATYRLMDNDKLSPEIVLASHREQTIERMKGHDVVLAIQDTTDIIYNGQPNSGGVGRCSSFECQRGLLVHSTLAVTTNGVPLGLLDQYIWTRPPEETGKRTRRKELPTEDKESRRWLEALDRSLQGTPKDTTVVTVCDREADIYDFFHKAILEGSHLLVRAVQNRRVIEEQKTLFQQVESSAEAGKVRVDIPRDTHNNHPPRQATLSVKFCRVTIMPPKNRKKDEALSDIPLNAILAKEIDPPEGVTPIYWLLLTTLPVNSLESALEKIDWYKERWKIERFHYTLKSGCKVEELQLETMRRLKNAIAIYSVVAWRLLWITYQARQTPEAPCSIVLEEHEWKALYCMVNKTSIPPDTPPTLKEAVLLIAKLGGFLARKGDGKPGVKVLWRGLQRLKDISDMWLISRLQISSSNVGNA